MTGTPCFNIVKARLLSIFDSLITCIYLRNCMQNQKIADLLLTQVDPLKLGKLEATVSTLLSWHNYYTLLCLYCIVLYCIMRPYTDGPIGPLSYRHSSGVVRNPHSTLAKWGIFNLRSMSSQGTHLLIARRRNSINSVLVTISWMTCLIATREPRTINLSIAGERITFTMYPVSLEPVTVWLVTGEHFVY